MKKFKTSKEKKIHFSLFKIIKKRPDLFTENNLRGKSLHETHMILKTHIKIEKFLSEHKYFSINLIGDPIKDWEAIKKQRKLLRLENVKNQHESNKIEIKNKNTEENHKKKRRKTRKFNPHENQNTTHTKNKPQVEHHINPTAKADISTHHNDIEKKVIDFEDINIDNPGKGQKEKTVKRLAYTSHH